ncbi:MAG: hypothetical protein WCJ35_01755 [Planctomycetota bacterium]
MKIIRPRFPAKGTKSRGQGVGSWPWRSCVLRSGWQAYRDSVLPPDVTKRVAVKLGIDRGWCKYIGRCGRFLCMTSHGTSAPVGVLLKHYGFTVENLVKLAKEAAGRCGKLVGVKALPSNLSKGA